MTKLINKFYSLLPSLFSPRGRGRKRTLVILVMIVLLSAFLRFYRLGQIPPSLDWDEVSLGYNAWALAETGRDEFGNSWPLSMRSFGDYKPPVYTYFLITSLKIFGRTEFAVRFPSAVAGTLTVVVTYYLVKVMFSENSEDSDSRKVRLSDDQTIRQTDKQINRQTDSRFIRLSDNLIIRSSGSLSFLSVLNVLPLFSAFLLAISPWHLQFSRIGFEANVALFFFVTGMWLLLRALRQKSPWSLFFSVVSMSGGLMAYHSLRVVMPLLVFVTLWIYRMEFLVLLRCNLVETRLHLFIKSLLPIILSAILAILTILTISYTVFFQKVGQSRFEKTSFLTIDNLLTVSQDRLGKYGKNPLDKIINLKYFVYGKQYIKGYLDHFDLKFWFLDGDRIDRHRASSVGLLYWWELPFLFMGFMSLIGPMSPMATKEKAVLFLWLLLAPAASALTGGTPSAVRSLVFLPTFQIFTAIGLVRTWAIIRIVKFQLALFIASCFLLLASFEITHYFHQYYIHSPLEYAPAWQYGYKQMVGKVMAEKDNYKKILITTSYDQPYIYFLWYGNYDPKIWVNDGEFNKRFDKFEFKKIDRMDIPYQENTLIVGTPLEIPSGNLKWRVDYPDGKAAFLATEK